MDQDAEQWHQINACRSVPTLDPYPGSETTGIQYSYSSKVNELACHVEQHVRDVERWQKSQQLDSVSGRYLSQSPSSPSDPMRYSEKGFWMNPEDVLHRSSWDEIPEQLEEWSSGYSDQNLKYDGLPRDVDDRFTRYPEMLPKDQDDRLFRHQNDVSSRSKLYLENRSEMAGESNLANNPEVLTSHTSANDKISQCTWAVDKTLVLEKQAKCNPFVDFDENSRESFYNKRQRLEFEENTYYKERDCNNSYGPEGTDNSRHSRLALSDVDIPDPDIEERSSRISLHYESLAQSSCDSRFTDRQHATDSQSTGQIYKKKNSEYDETFPGSSGQYSRDREERNSITYDAEQSRQPTCDASLDRLLVLGNCRHGSIEKEIERYSSSDESLTKKRCFSSFNDKQENRDDFYSSREDIDKRNWEMEWTQAESNLKPTSAGRHFDTVPNVVKKDQENLQMSLNKESIEDIINNAYTGCINMTSIETKYKIPGNCIHLQAPEVEYDVLIRLSELARNEDTLLRNAQLLLSVGMVPVINLADLFITNLFSVEQAKVYVVDGLVLLGHAFYEMINCLQSLFTRSADSNNLFNIGSSIVNDKKDHFEDVFPIGKELGFPVNTYVANMVNLACSKWGEIDSIQSKYISNSNCKNLLFPKINVPRNRCITEQMRKCEIRLEYINKCLATGIAPLIEFALSIQSKDVDITQVSAFITDSLTLLSHTMYRLSLHRSRVLRFHLTNEFNMIQINVFSHELFEEVTSEDDESNQNTLVKGESNSSKYEKAKREESILKEGRERRDEGRGIFDTSREVNEHNHADSDGHRQSSRDRERRLYTVDRREKVEHRERKGRHERSRSPKPVSLSRSELRRERICIDRRRSEDAKSSMTCESNPHKSSGRLLTLRHHSSRNRRNCEMERTPKEGRDRPFKRDAKSTSITRPSHTNVHGSDGSYYNQSEYLQMPLNFTRESIEDIVNKACNGSINLESIDTIYKIPENCNQMKAPELADDVLARMSELTRNEDKLLRNAQQFLSLGIVPVINLANLFINNSFSVEKANVYTVDALILLGKAFYEIAYCQKSLLAKGEGESVHENRKIFEDEFPKRDEFGQSVDKNIANMVNLACNKWGEIEGIQFKYVTKIDVSKQKHVSEQIIKCDSRLKYVKKCLTTGIALLIQCSLSMQSKSVDIETVSGLITDSLMLLGHTMFNMSLFRCRRLRGDFPAEFNVMNKKLFTTELFDEVAPEDNESILDTSEESSSSSRKCDDAKHEEDVFIRTPKTLKCSICDVFVMPTCLEIHTAGRRHCKMLKKKKNEDGDKCWKNNEAISVKEMPTDKKVLQEMVLKIQEHRVKMMCQRTNILKSELERMCIPVCREGSFDKRQQAKIWIVSRSKDQSHCDLIMLFFVMKVFMQSTDSVQRLRLMYLLNDILVYGCDNGVVETPKGRILRNSLELVIVPVISYILTQMEDTGYKQKVFRLIQKWESLKMFSKDTTEKMEDPEEYLKKYHEQLFKQYGKMLDETTETLGEEKEISDSRSTITETESLRDWSAPVLASGSTSVPEQQPVQQSSSYQTEYMRMWPTQVSFFSSTFIPEQQSVQQFCSYEGGMVQRY